VNIHNFVARLGSALPNVVPLPKAGDPGIDAARYQKVINWFVVAQTTIFAFLKATEGYGYTDPTFVVNWLESYRKLARGPYHFYRPDLRQPRRQARYFYETVTDQGADGELEWMVDLEHPIVMRQAVNLIPFRPFLDSDLREFINELNLLGVATSRIGIYSRRSFINLWFPDSTWMSAHPLWVANYPLVWPNPTYKPKLPKHWTQAKYWQYDNGEMPWSEGVPGVPARVDRDLCLV